MEMRTYHGHGRRNAKHRLGETKRLDDALKPVIDGQRLDLIPFNELDQRI